MKQLSENELLKSVPVVLSDEELLEVKGGFDLNANTICAKYVICDYCNNCNQCNNCNICSNCSNCSCTFTSCVVEKEEGCPLTPTKAVGVCLA